jgi:hypothetical protein
MGCKEINTLALLVLMLNKNRVCLIPRLNYRKDEPSSTTFQNVNVDNID